MLLSALFLAAGVSALAASSDTHHNTDQISNLDLGDNNKTGANANSGDSDIEIITQRRKVDLAAFTSPAQLGDIDTWLGSQREDGTWADLDYRTGCDAQRANWPIQQHWIRVIAFASAHSGLHPAAPVGSHDNSTLRDAALRGLDWWFAHDYTSPDCFNRGGKANGTCPCGTPGLWNTNWYAQAILVPQLLGTACLLLDDQLSAAQRASCEVIPMRAWAWRDDKITGGDYLTAANTINVMLNTVSAALLAGNETVLAEAYTRAWAAVGFEDAQGKDGIHRDGAFLQHDGLLYTGNYGKDLINAFIQLEGEAIGTPYAATRDAREAFAALIRGSEWMVVVDQTSRREYWDLNTIGRFIAFSTQDFQASSDININTTLLAAAVADFSGATEDVSDAIRRLRSNGTEQLLGNRMFPSADYMVHRREGYVLANKLISTRSGNTEWANGANPYGHHLGQGALFTYVHGGEYRDVMAVWDWNLVPGTTVVLGLPELKAETVGVRGKNDFVGGVSDGWVGASVMEYQDPHGSELAYRKAWFYVDECVIVSLADVVHPPNASAPVVSVLENRRAEPGTLMLDGVGVGVGASAGRITAQTLFYGGNGFIAHGAPFDLALFEGERTGDWSAISTSSAGNATVDMFSAYTTHAIGGDDIASYAFYPATTPEHLQAERERPSVVPVRGEGILGAAGRGRLAVVFFPDSEGAIDVDARTIGWTDEGVFTVRSEHAAAYLFALREDADGRIVEITAADPSQRLEVLSLSLSGLGLKCAEGDGGCVAEQGGVRLTLTLPRGGMAGGSVFAEVLIA